MMNDNREPICGSHSPSDGDADVGTGGGIGDKSEGNLVWFNDELAAVFSEGELSKERDCIEGI